MDGSANISFTWGDGARAFRLGMKELRRLQDKTGTGPHALYMRIATKAWKVDDLRETILQGLLGGGMVAEDAAKLVKQFVDERPLLHSVTPALVILGAALSGGDEDDPEKKAPLAGSADPQTGSISANLSEAQPQ